MIGVGASIIIIPSNDFRGQLCYCKIFEKSLALEIRIWNLRFLQNDLVNKTTYIWELGDNESDDGQQTL